MPWIARDQNGLKGNPPYRLFGNEPSKLQLTNWEGERIDNQFTWSTCKEHRFDDTYKPLANHEGTVLPDKDSPFYLEPGEGPIEVKLTAVHSIPARTFEGEGI